MLLVALMVMNALWTSSEVYLPPHFSEQDSAAVIQVLAILNVQLEQLPAHPGLNDDGTP